jgi:hypothetical protein
VADAPTPATPDAGDNRTVRTGGGRRLAIGAAAAALAVAAAAFAAAAGETQPPARLAGCDVFPPFRGAVDAREAGDQTAWNQDVSRAPKDPRSSAYLDRISAEGGNQAIHPDFGGNGRYGIPYTVVGADQHRYPVHFDAYGPQSDPGPYPIPPDARVEGGSDRHVLAIERGRCRLYELFAAHFDHDRGRWDAASGATFDLGRGGPLRHDGWTSADAAGLPILPGLVRPGEVADGVIRHAIRVTFDETREGYIHPATHYASDQCDRDLPPMGLRLRLGAGYFHRNLDRFPPGSQSRVIFVALYHYGIINADNGGNWFITGAASKRWDDEDLDRLKSVPGRAFVVVRAGRIHTPC